MTAAVDAHVNPNCAFGINVPPVTFNLKRPMVIGAAVGIVGAVRFVKNTLLEL